MGKRDGPRLCFCKYYDCQGKALTASDWKVHNLLSEEAQQKVLEAEVARIALIDPQPPSGRPFETGATLPKDGSSTKPPVSVPSRYSTPLTSGTAQPSSPVPPKPDQHLPSTRTSGATELYRELYHLDLTMHNRIQTIQQVLRAWSHGGRSTASSHPDSCFSTRREVQQFLTEEVSWLRETVARINSVEVHNDHANELLRASMIERANQTSVVVSKVLETWTREEEDIARSPEFFDTGEDFRRLCHNVKLMIRMEKFFLHPLRTHNTVVVAALFMAVALNLLANVARSPCNFILRMMKVVLGLSLRDPKDRVLLEELPDDIRTARKRFNLDPSTTIYACCPACSFPHPPTKRSGSDVDMYPARCSAKRYPGSKPCGARLTKFGVKNGESVRVPIRAYPMQSFRAFVGGMLSRPGMEEAITRAQKMMAEDGEIWDIMEANAVRNLPGPDGRLFLDSTDEIRSIWSLSYDGFNPLTNKAAGKSTSVGSLAMMCLSLPPSLRY